MQFFLQMQELVALALHHPCDRYSRPAAHHFGYVVGRDFLAYHGIAVLCGAQLCLNLLYVFLQSLQTAVAYLCHAFVVAFAFGTLGLELQLFHLLFVLLNLVHQTFLALPLCTERTFFVLEFGNVLVELCYLVGVVLALYGFALDFKLLQPACYLVEFFRHRVALHTQFCCRLVHKVDGLVGQETVADVAFGQFHGCNAGVVLNTHLVVVLVTLLQSTQNGYCREFVRFVHHYSLEASFERLVLLEVLLILVKRRGTNASEFATSKRRLQDVGCIHRTLASSGTHKSVYFVDEEYYTPVGIGDFLDDALETLLELALVLGSGNECSHVERVELLVLQVLRHVATHYTFCQTFNDCCLTRTRFTY